jgi:glucose-1-phosphate cytidylyltransferase
MTQGWINGGFFVIEPKFLKFIRNDYTILERDPLEKASSANELVAYKHKKFWHCMDTIKDKEGLEKLIQQNNAPWL